MTRSTQPKNPGAGEIAVVGMAARFPEAPNPRALWNNIVDGKQSFGDVPSSRWNNDTFYSEIPRAIDRSYVRHGAFLDDVDQFAALHYGIAPRRVTHMDPQHRLLYDAVREALQDAGWEQAAFDRKRTGTFVGISSSEYRNFLNTRSTAMAMLGGAYGDAPHGDGVHAVAESVAKLTPISSFSLPGSLLNMAAANIAHQWGLEGPAFAIDAACASALVAVYEAMLYLRTGQCDRALAGGVYLNLTPENQVSFSRIGAMSRQGSCRPFDAEADGFLQGEGVGVVVLRRLEDALQEGDRIHAVIRGGGINNDGAGSSGPMAPSRAGQVDVLRAAYDDAGVDPATIDFVECHGTATKVGDPVEVQALQEAMPARGTPVWLSSIKGNIGHTMSAAGIAGLLKAILVLKHRTIPPQAGYRTLNPDLGLDPTRFAVTSESTPWDTEGPRRAGVSSFGFGGTNCHLVVEEAPSKEHRPVISVRSDAPELVVVSAATRAQLGEMAQATAETLAADPNLALTDVAFTLTATRRFEAWRLALVARNLGDLQQKLKRAAQTLAGDAPLPESLESGVVVGEVAPNESPTLAFMLPGQGAQRLDLLRGLFDRFPVFRERLLELQDALSDLLPQPLLSYLYPTPGLTEEERQRAESQLQATEVCQPAMAALGLALAEFLRALGIRPTVCLGHSLGEFAAAGVGGMLTPADAVRFVAERGRLMANLDLADPGAMAAVMASPEVTEKHLSDPDAVWIANRNHPRQTVVSGTTPAVEATLRRLQKAGVGAKRLKVSHAFHSPVLKDVVPPLNRLIDTLTVMPPAVPVVSAIAKAPYPDSPEAIRAVFRQHAIAPVDYIGAVQQAQSLGATLFLQVGGGQALAKFARSTAQKASTLALSGTGDDVLELLEVLGRLAIAGTPADLRALFHSDSEVVSLPATPLATQRYWVLSDKRTPLNHLAAPVKTPEATPESSEATAPFQGADVKQDEDALMRLFREQNALLAQHAQILADQTAALAGRRGPRQDVAGTAPNGAPPKPAANGAAVVEQAPTLPTTSGDGASEIARSTPATSPESVPAQEISPDSNGGTGGAPSYRETVLEAVAEVSAFPRDTLRGDQSLALDLGFDSLMFVELGTKLQNQLPGVEFPQTLMTQKTTVDDLVAHLEEGATEAVPPEIASSKSSREDDDQPLTVYTPHLVDRPRSELPAPRWADPGWLLVTADRAGIADALAERLVEEGYPVALVQLGEPFEGVSNLADNLKCLSWPEQPETVPALFGALADAEVMPRGVVHLASLDVREELKRVLEGHAWPQPVPLAQQLAAHLWRACDGAPEVFAVLTGMGGSLGLDAAGASGAVWQAGLVGFTQALAREWPNTRVKVLDVHPAQGAEDVAQQVADELLSASRDVAVAFVEDRRRVPELRISAPASSNADFRLDRDSVVLIAGGGQGLGYKAALDLARRTQCGLILVGRSDPQGDSGLQSRLEALTQAGARAHYVRADLSDPAFDPQCLQPAREALGPIDVVIHAAGRIADRRVTEKTPAEIDAVMGVKIDGLLHLARATRRDPVRRWVAFSSWAGYFGNTGQTDYAAANALMNRLVTLLGEDDTLAATSIDWPPWTDSPMTATLPEAVQETLRRQGVTFVGDRAGLDALQALLTEGAPGEVLVGRDVPLATQQVRAHLPMSLDSHPFVGDHRVQGKPVLPLASALNTLVEATPAETPYPLEVRQLQLFSGVTLDRRLILAVDVERRLEASNAASVARVDLRAQDDTGDRLAYRAEVTGRPQDVSSPLAVPASSSPLSSLPLALSDFYDQGSFHGPLLQGIKHITSIGRQHIVGEVATSSPAQWLRSPTSPRWRIDPLVIDASFQLVLYWVWTQRGKLAHPVGFERYLQLAPFADAPGPIRCTVVLDGEEGDLLRGSIQYEDAEGRPLAQMQGARAQLLQAPQRPTSEPKLSQETTAATSSRPPEMPSLDDVDEQHYRVDQFPEVVALQQRLQAAEIIGLRNPFFHVHDGIARNTSVVEGREMINFSSYNYLGLSGHPAVAQAAKDAVDRYGTSVSASRVASGERPIHSALEKELADLLRVEDAVVFSAGHATNETTIGHLMGSKDLILHDWLAHNSVQTGAALSGAKRRPFPHNDYQALEKLLQQLRPQYEKVMVIIEGVYSMDGDIPDLPRFIELRNKYKCLLFVDEAHSAGVLGQTGAGIGEHCGIDPNEVDVWMGTLSKSFSSCGGYIGGRRALVDYLKYTAPGFVFSAGISPANAAAALSAIQHMRAHPDLVETLRSRSEFFLKRCQANGLNTGLSHDSAVVPCIVGNSLHCLKLAQRLADRGINVQPIVYPAVDDDAARLRFFLSSTHTEEQLAFTADTLAEELARVLANEDVEEEQAPAS